MGKKPAIRFESFTEDWEQRKLGELTAILSASRVHKDDWCHEGIPFFRSSDVMAALNGTENEKVYISKELYEKLSEVSGRLEKGDILVTGGGSVGNPYIVPNDKPLYTKDADLLWLKRSDNLNTLYAYTFFFTPVFRSYLKGISHIGTIAHYTIEQLKATPIPLPCIDEQCQVGIFFHSLDHLITLHQCNYEKMVATKKSMLDKLFPQGEEKVPAIRFEGFEGDWEKYKFSEVFDFLQNNTLSRAELSNSQSDVMNVHYGDILVRYGAILDIKKDKMTYLLNESLVEKYKASLLQNGDIIIADTAEDKTVGKCSEIVGLTDEQVLAGLHTIPCRPKRKFAEGFTGYYMNSNSYHNQLLPLIQGTKVSSVSKASIQDTYIVCPDSELEQKQIAGCLKSLDDLIELYRIRVEKLKNIKAACLQGMFV